MEKQQIDELTKLIDMSLHNIDSLIDIKEARFTCGAYLKIIKSAEYEFMLASIVIPEHKLRKYNIYKDKYKTMWGKLPWEQ